MDFTASDQQVSFLDLNLVVEGDKILTTTHFKETDWNSFISVDSCHQASWLKALPKSKFMRLKWNCSLKKDYFSQAHKLRSYFLDKGYNGNMLDSTIREVGLIERVLILSGTNRRGGSDESFKSSFITSYSTQHFILKRIIKMH